MGNDIYIVGYNVSKNNEENTTKISNITNKIDDILNNEYQGKNILITIKEIKDIEIIM
jgi:hypothetical protein